jgi:hypothetical protein
MRVKMPFLVGAAVGNASLCPAAEGEVSASENSYVRTYRSDTELAASLGSLPQEGAKESPW